MSEKKSPPEKLPHKFTQCIRGTLLQLFRQCIRLLDHTQHHLFFLLQKARSGWGNYSVWFIFCFSFFTWLRERRKSHGVAVKRNGVSLPRDSTRSNERDISELELLSFQYQDENCVGEPHILTDNGNNATVVRNANFITAFVGVRDKVHTQGNSKVLMNHTNASNDPTSFNGPVGDFFSDPANPFSPVAYGKSSIQAIRLRKHFTCQTQLMVQPNEPTYVGAFAMSTDIRTVRQSPLRALWGWLWDRTEYLKIKSALLVFVTCRILKPDET